MSIAEVEMQDVHQSIVIGIACVSNSTKQADSIIQNVVNYIEGNTEAIVQNIETEII
ncbi:hypothetical protein CFSAN001627_02535 [Clostridium botulinum CFSAN001627]|uniref:DUF503 domain-containing protein n=1 Tax=Clostridium botulinum CFSAN001627 TaxID=1232189 RepID=M1ZZG9_CLOBO|nr:hypothetical protein CFSAN001627_02535 [Clostridium botulinum CFSAN001627]